MFINYCIGKEFITERGNTLCMGDICRFSGLVDNTLFIDKKITNQLFNKVLLDNPQIILERERETNRHSGKSVFIYNQIFTRNIFKLFQHLF